MSVLRLKTVKNFQGKINPCAFRPYYSEDCTFCMDEFCKLHSTTREEYHRKRQHLFALQKRVIELWELIKDQIRQDPTSFQIGWYGKELNGLEKEIEEI